MSVFFPTYPARPTNVGPLPEAEGSVIWDMADWREEPKVNGRRVLLNWKTGVKLNRHGEELSAAHDYDAAIAALAKLGLPYDWVDCEGMGKSGLLANTLIVLDVVPWTAKGGAEPIGYEDRRELVARVPELVIGNELRAKTLVRMPSFPVDKCQQLAMWKRLAERNEELKACPEAARASNSDTSRLRFYEGVVRKQVGSPYPVQLVNDDKKTNLWVKSRWEW